MVGTLQLSRALADLQFADTVLEQGIQNALALLLDAEHQGTSGPSSKSPLYELPGRLQCVYRSDANEPGGATQQFRELVDVAGDDRDVHCNNLLGLDLADA